MAFLTRLNCKRRDSRTTLVRWNRIVDANVEAAAAVRENGRLTTAMRKRNTIGRRTSKQESIDFLVTTEIMDRKLHFLY
jgi:hypothetical protein